MNRKFCLENGKRTRCCQKSYFVYNKLNNKQFFYLVYLYVYLPDSQESDGSANTSGKQLSRPASGDAKILLSG